MTPTGTAEPAQGTAKDLPLTRGDLLERCGRVLPEHARVNPARVTSDGLAPKDLAEPVTTVSDDARRWEIHRHPARHRGGKVVLVSYHDRGRSKIVATGTLAESRDSVDLELVGQPTARAWIPRTDRRAVWPPPGPSRGGLRGNACPRGAPRRPRRLGRRP